MGAIVGGGALALIVVLLVCWVCAKLNSRR